MSAISPNGAEEHPIGLTLNGQRLTLQVNPWTTLLDLLREQLDLVGTKKGCDHGQCGACTVLRDGKRVNACLTLAIMCDGAELVTIEGLASGDVLHPMQRAFITHDAFQCGYCTPGQICSAVGLAREGRDSTCSVDTHPPPGASIRLGARRWKPSPSRRISRARLARSSASGSAAASFSR